MDHRRRTILASAGIVGIFVLVQLGAIALVEPFQQEGHQVVEDTGNPTISIAYLVGILVMTGVMLVAIKYGGISIMRVLIIFSGSYIAFYVFQVFVPNVVPVTVGGTTVNPLAVLGALALGGGLYAYPEWYVIDAAGIVMGIGAAGLFGVNFGVLPALVLLVVLAVYDAISVYGTEHMLTLASGAMEMRVPVVLVVPLSLSYSFLEDDGPDALENDEADESNAGTETDTEGDDQSGREALFIGLGDAVIPTVLVASAAFFEIGSMLSVLGLPTTLPALTAMGGTLCGLVVLLWMVLKGRAHAGLPLLNGGAIGGYLLGALLSGLSLVEALGVDGFV